VEVWGVVLDFLDFLALVPSCNLPFLRRFGRGDWGGAMGLVIKYCALAVAASAATAL